MKLTWYGHSCFLLETTAGTRVLMDPCDPETGYTLQGIPADLVTVSHNHHDHNYIKAAKGTPVIVRTAGSVEEKGVRISGYPTFHDASKGRQRGSNLVFAVDADGMRLVHLGDLGHQLSHDIIQQLGPVDVLMCPIGGRFTIDAAGAKKVIDAVNPRMVAPMHYRTAALTFDIEGLAPFIKFPGEWNVLRVGDSSYELDRDAMPEQAILVLAYQ